MTLANWANMPTCSTSQNFCCALRALYPKKLKFSTCPTFQKSWHALHAKNIDVPYVLYIPLRVLYVKVDVYTCQKF